MPKKRNRHQRPPRTILHIFCEGESEKNYIKGYKSSHCPGKRTVIVESTDKNTPIQLVDEAVKMKNDGERSMKGDSFWVVYDRESEQKYPDKLHAQARNNAEREDIKIAISNVCFEVWILLHFQENVGPYTCHDDLSKKSDFRKHLPSYDKADKKVFDLLKDKVDTARDNAPRSNNRTKDSANPEWTLPHQWNPYTNVYELLDEIDRF